MSEIVHLTHDDGTFSEYGSAPNSRLTVTVAAALNSTAYGVEKNNSGSSGDGGLTVSLNGATAEIRCGFYLDLNTLAITPTGIARLFYFFGGGAGESFYIDIRDEGSGDFIRVITQDDTPADVNTDTPAGGLPGGEMTVEVVWTKASSAIANDGICEILINGVQAAITSNIDFYNSFNGFANVGSSLNISTNAWTGSGTVYYDEIIVRDDSTPIYPAAGSAFRFLGFAADSENLYASGLKDAATLQLFDYDLPTLTEGGTASFGSGTDAELDAITRGIFPVVKPMADQVLYLRGRDGNNVQVQYNDQNGTLGWVDIGPGTATWGTDKYAVGLLTAPTYTDDVIAVFSDDDVYRTRFGTETWVKMGDAGTGLLAAARHPTRFNEIMVAGTAAGTVEWSNNFGATFGDVSGTALGTINAFEVSL